MFKEFWRCYLTLKCLIIASLPMLLATVKGASFDMIVGAILPPWSWTKELFTSGKLAPFVTNVQGKQTCILYRPLDAAALSMTYVVVYSLDLYVVCRLIYLFVSGLYSLACFHLLDLARESIQLQRIFLALVGQKFHRAKVEGLTAIRDLSWNWKMYPSGAFVFSKTPRRRNVWHEDIDINEIKWMGKSWWPKCSSSR